MHASRGFGFQGSFGRNLLELLVYYLMSNKCKNLKDMKPSCLSVLVALKITKVDISCIRMRSNFITCIRIYNVKTKNHYHAKY